MTVVWGVLLDRGEVDPAQTHVLVHEARSVGQQLIRATFPGDIDLAGPGRRRN